MATFNLTLTFPDAQQARVLAGLKAAWPNPDGSVPTNPQITERLRQEVKDLVRNTVGSVEARAAAKAVVPPDVT